MLGLLAVSFCKVEARVVSVRCNSCSTLAVSSLSLAGSSESLASPSEADGVVSNCTGL